MWGTWKSLLETRVHGNHYLRDVDHGFPLHYVAQDRIFDIDLRPDI
jgi:hypothetical protein